MMFVGGVLLLFLSMSGILLGWLISGSWFGLALFSPFVVVSIGGLMAFFRTAV